MADSYKICGTTKYQLEIVDDVICLIDLNGGMTIANNAENVIAQLEEEGYDLTAHPVIYSEAEGKWDWLLVVKGRFAAHKHICNDCRRDYAIREAKRLRHAARHIGGG